MPTKAVIYGHANSTAQAYAEKYGRTFYVLGTEGLIYEQTAGGAAWAVVGYEGREAEVVVPEMYRNLPVVSVALEAFGLNDGYTLEGDGPIVLPDDILGAVKVTQITFLSKTITIPDSASAILSDVTLCGYTGSTAQKYAQKYGHTFIMLPEIYSASVGIGADITVFFSAYLNEDQTDAVMEITMNGKVTTVQGVPTATPNKYQFAFEGVGPHLMGDNIKARLMLDGDVLHELGSYSVKQYCLNMKARADAKTLGLSDAQHEALATLIADMLEYGAASQLYANHNTDALVNVGVSGASEYVALGDEYKMPALKETTVPGYQFHGATVELSNVVNMYFMIKAEDISRVTVKVGGLTFDADDFTEKVLEDGSTVYELRSDAVYAYDLDKSCVLSLRVDGVECQKLTYSVVNYIYNKQNDTANANLTALLKRIRNYGLSAEAYKTAPNSEATHPHQMS